MKIGRVLVAVTGQPTDEDAIQLACGAARRQKAKIFVIYVIEVRRALPLNAELQGEMEKAERVLAHAEQIADHADYSLETELLQAREVGPAIVDEAVERGVDAIVMGAPYDRRFGEFTLGSTTEYVLKHAPCAVWVCRAAVPAGA